MTGKGIVIETDGGKAKVRVPPSTACIGCPSKSHCHGGEMKPRDIIVINDSGAKVTDAVVFEADTWKMIVSATLIWILPVVSMIVGYLIAEWQASLRAGRGSDRPLRPNGRSKTQISMKNSLFRHRSGPLPSLDLSQTPPRFFLVLSPK